MWLHELLLQLRDILVASGLEVVGVNIYPSSEPGRWEGGIYIAAEPGTIAKLTLSGLPLGPSQTRQHVEARAPEKNKTENMKNFTIRARHGIEEWERRLEAVGLYFVEPKPEEQVQK